MIANEECWEIELGRSIGPFKFGATLSDCIYALMHRDPIRKFDVIYDETNPLSSDIMIKSYEDGLVLRFHPDSQQLHLIDVYDIGKVRLTFQQKSIAGSLVDSTFQLLYKAFGPTHPGQYNSKQKSYFLSFDSGVCVLFPIPPEFVSKYATGNEIPMEFPDGSTPAATRMLFYYGGQFDQPSICPSSTAFYFEKVRIESDRVFFTERNKTIHLNTTAQDVVSEIGQPLSSYHKPPKTDGVTSCVHASYRDYFHNYPHLGMDLLYNAKTNRLQKIIFHSNFPGHPEFNAYLKCNFELCIPSEYSKATQDATITSQSTWEDVQMLIAKSEFPPIVLDSGTAAHPFGSTHCYTPFPYCTLEVMRNGYIASVTVAAH